MMMMKGCDERERGGEERSFLGPRKKWRRGRKKGWEEREKEEDGAKKSSRV